MTNLSLCRGSEEAHTAGWGEEGIYSQQGGGEKSIWHDGTMRFHVPCPKKGREMGITSRGASKRKTGYSISLATELGSTLHVQEISLDGNHAEGTALRCAAPRWASRSFGLHSTHTVNQVLRDN